MGPGGSSTSPQQVQGGTQLALGPGGTSTSPQQVQGGTQLALGAMQVLFGRASASLQHNMAKLHVVAVLGRGATPNLPSTSVGRAHAPYQQPMGRMPILALPFTSLGGTPALSVPAAHGEGEWVLQQMMHGSKMSWRDARVSFIPKGERPFFAASDLVDLSGLSQLRWCNVHSHIHAHASCATGLAWEAGADPSIQHHSLAC